MVVLEAVLWVKEEEPVVVVPVAVAVAGVEV